MQGDYITKCYSATWIVSYSNKMTGIISHYNG